MRTRHRIPSVFNLSMVDVLCCALGCVILLWLLNLREAKQKAVQAGRSDEQVLALRRDLDAARGQLQDASSRYAALQSQLDAAEAEARATAALLKKAQAERDTETARVGRLEKDMAALKAGKASDEAALARRAKEMAALQGELRDRGADATAAARRADDLAAKLKDAEARVKDYRDKLAAEEAVAKGLEKEINKRMQGLQDAENGLSARDRDLAAARRAVTALEDEKKRLIADAERVRAAADNRFAGIQLTGRRVVFLVDMSGSMEYVDEKTLAPDKWSGVRETLAKIMRSLPNLEKFQVVLFSDKVTFLLGDEGGWLDYDAKSAERATAALTKIRPKGGTNMYAAFEAAFRFRARGLDAIYLLSDGLPNLGEGLSDEQAKGLKETEQADILGKYVRRKLRDDWNRDIRNQPRVRVNAVGFFYESPDVGAFLWSLTRENGGGFVGMSRP
jgi:hypothetical protein